MPELKLVAGSDSLTATRDPRLGIVAAKAKCYAPDLGTALFAPPLDIGIAIPEWNPRAVNRIEAGDVAGYIVILSFEGHPEPDTADGESFELEGTTSDDPIESHWNYEALLKNYKGSEDSNGRAHWKRTLIDSGGVSGRNRMHGVDAWAAPGLIWNHNWVSKTLPGDIVSELGAITSPPGNPPSLSGNRNWLCIRCRARNRGNVWQVQQSFQLSGPGGFVPEMYKRA